MAPFNPSLYKLGKPIDKKVVNEETKRRNKISESNRKKAPVTLPAIKSFDGE